MISRSMPIKPPKKHEGGRNRRGYGIGTLTASANVSGVSVGEVAEGLAGEGLTLIGGHPEIRGLLHQDVVVHPTEAIIEVLHQGAR